MNTETEPISRALMMLRGRFDGRLQVLAEKMGISKQRLSAYLNGAVPTKRIGRDILAIFAQEFPTETGPSTASESTPPHRVECEAKPIGYITNRGEKWEESVPFYADDALNEKAIRMAERLRPKGSQVPPNVTSSAAPSPEDAIKLAEADRMGAALRTKSTGTGTPANP